MFNTKFNTLIVFLNPWWCRTLKLDFKCKVRVEAAGSYEFCRNSSGFEKKIVFTLKKRVCGSFANDNSDKTAMITKPQCCWYRNIKIHFMETADSCILCLVFRNEFEISRIIINMSSPNRRSKTVSESSDSSEYPAINGGYSSSPSGGLNNPMEAKYLYDIDGKFPYSVYEKKPELYDIDGKHTYK